MPRGKRTAPQTRRNDLIDAATRAFARKTVANTTVGDIVKEAGVAQGTFYLYFASKEDVMDAVAELITERMVAGIEKQVASIDGGAAAKFLALRDAVLLAAEGDSGTREIAETYHRPENRAIHDRMAKRMMTRMAPLVEGIVREGVAEGIFISENPRAAAWIILGGLHAVEAAFPNRGDVAKAMADTTAFMLRGLGASDFGAMLRPEPEEAT